MLDDHLAILPDPVNSDGSTLDSIHFSPTEVKDILSTLKVGKASGPDNVNNRILKEAAVPLSNHLCDFLITPCLNVYVPIYGKRQTYLLFT